MFNLSGATNKILLGILICLVVIAFKPYPSFDFPSFKIPEFPEELDVRKLGNSNVIQLDKNRFAIIGQDENSYTKILVVEYDDVTQKINRISKSSFDFNFEFNFNK